MNFRSFHKACFLFVFLVSLQGMKIYAQQTLVEVRIDNPDLMIGEHTMLHVTVTTDIDKQVLVPLPDDLLMNGVEVLQIFPPDTNDIKNNRMTIRYDLLITSFDSALYLLPSFVAIDGRDTVLSNQVALKISSPDVDLEHPEEFYDIKKIWRPPFVLADYYALIYGVLFTLFLICVAGYFVQRIRNKPKKAQKVEEGPKLSPHEQAFKELKAIRERKLWQQGRNKEYHTAVTDTLRHYITARYGESAMEKTTLEILEILRNEEPGNKEVYDLLRKILHLADFVKFAKLHPEPDENEISMFDANLFVDKTKKVEANEPLFPDNTDTETDKNVEPVHK